MDQQTNHQSNKSGSFLSFRIGEEEFAAHVRNVVNILEMTRITSVPQTPDYLLGVINLRGSVLPVVDTRIKFGIAKTDFTASTCIVVCEIQAEGENIFVGAVVDSVLEVLELNENQVEPPPSIGNSFQSEYISGMAKVDDRFVMILDMNLLFSGIEMEQLQDAGDETV